jgi:hypothetical protein
MLDFSMQASHNKHHSNVILLIPLLAKQLQFEEAKVISLCEKDTY